MNPSWRSARPPERDRSARPGVKGGGIIAHYAQGAKRTKTVFRIASGPGVGSGPSVTHKGQGQTKNFALGPVGQRVQAGGGFSQIGVRHVAGVRIESPVAYAA